MKIDWSMIWDDSRSRCCALECNCSSSKWSDSSQWVL